jgi:preprotein translocase subunit Sec63
MRDGSPEILKRERGGIHRDGPGKRPMMRFVTLLVFIIVGYSFFRYIIRLLKQGIRQRTGRSGYRYENREQAHTEEEYRRILGVTDKDSRATIRKKYKELLAKYHPDKVQHLGIEFQEMAERKTRAIIQAYDFFRKK